MGDRWLETLAAGGMSMTCASYGAVDDATAWLERAATAAMTVPSTSMARRMEMAGCMCSCSRRCRRVARPLRTSRRTGWHQEPGCTGGGILRTRHRDLQTLGHHGRCSLLDRAQLAAGATLDAIRPLPGDLPWEAVAHAVLAVVAEAEDRPSDAADESRIALSTLDGLTHSPLRKRALGSWPRADPSAGTRS